MTMLSLSLNYGIAEMLTGGCPEPRNRPPYGKCPKHSVFSVIREMRRHGVLQVVRNERRPLGGKDRPLRSSIHEKEDDLSAILL